MNNPVVIRVLDWCLKGCSRLEIRERIRDNDPLTTYTNACCDELIAQAKTLLSEIVSTDTGQTTSVHIGWYEEIYLYYDSIGNVPGANKSMKGKEKLLGLSGGSRTVINNKTEITINRNVKYDEVNRLTSLERVRVEWLLNKSLSKPLQITEVVHIQEIGIKTT